MAELQKLTVYIEPEDIVNRVLDEEEYKGKTLREWADCLSNPKTNADRIRSMSDEALADVLQRAMIPPKGRHCSMECRWDRCRDCWLDWLKSPVEVEDA